MLRLKLIGAVPSLTNLFSWPAVGKTKARQAKTGRTSALPCPAAGSDGRNSSASRRFLSNSLIALSSELIDYILQLAIEKSSDVGDYGIHQPRSRRARGPGDVRRDKTVSSVEQGIVCGRRLNRQNVQAGARNPPRVQSARKSRRVD